MLQIRIGRNGENFYGQVVRPSEDSAATFFCTKKDRVVNPKEHTIDEANATYQKRVLDDGTRGYQEVVALDFHPNNGTPVSELPILALTEMIAVQLIDTVNPVNAAHALENWLCSTGMIVYHHQNASLDALVEAIASIRGPAWIF
jgi:hypothetical protein